MPLSIQNGFQRTLSFSVGQGAPPTSSGSDPATGTAHGSCAAVLHVCPTASTSIPHVGTKGLNGGGDVRFYRHQSVSYIPFGVSLSYVSFSGISWEMLASHVCPSSKGPVVTLLQCITDGLSLWYSVFPQSAPWPLEPFPSARKGQSIMPRRKLRRTVAVAPSCGGSRHICCAGGDLHPALSKSFRSPFIRQSQLSLVSQGLSFLLRITTQRLLLPFRRLTVSKDMAP